MWVAAVRTLRATPFTHISTRMTTFSPTPAVWKNGERLKLNLNSDVTVLGPIMAHNGNWICYGLAKEEDGNHGIIVENGKEVFRIKEPVQFQYLRIASSGDYYAVVSDDAGIYLWRINADTWEIVTKEDVAKDTDTYVWVPLAFHVGNRDIAIGFKKRQKEFPFEESGAYMWMNDGRGILTLDENGYISDITFFGGKLVAGGYIINQATSEKTAVQWVNGVPQDFSVGCQGNSRVSQIMNWNDMFRINLV